ncbi:hypothetical protein [Variovorax sp. LT1R16]|uniref:hypothetical protein n=1 Tax=Variovorax sp. LT1R16 TaxID=3443728 RepID=UPI003F4901A0
MTWVKNVAGFRDFLSLVIVHAPDDFPEEDYLAPGEQLNLVRAFGELYKGLELVSSSAGSNLIDVPALRDLLDRALVAYRAGEDVKGAHLLQEFEAAAFR